MKTSIPFVEAAEHINVFDVIPARDEVWVLVADGKIMDANMTRSELVNEAKVMALQFRPSRLVIRAMDGEIESITPFTREDSSVPRL